MRGEVLLLALVVVLAVAAPVFAASLGLYGAPFLVLVIVAAGVTLVVARRVVRRTAPPMPDSEEQRWRRRGVYPLVALTFLTMWLAWGFSGMCEGQGPGGCPTPWGWAMRILSALAFVMTAFAVSHARLTASGYWLLVGLGLALEAATFVALYVGSVP